MMPRRLIIHPGWSKTGTTAIQNYFADHFDKYVEYGFLYPRAGRLIDNAHHDLAFALKARPNLTASASARDLLASIRAEYASVGAQHLLLSSELFPFLPDYPEFGALCAEFDVVEVVFTLRQQSKLIVSLYKHLLRDPSMVFYETFEEILAAHASWMNFHREISNWMTWPLASQMHVVCTSPALIRDFTAELQLPVFAESTPLVNTSPSDIAALVLAETTALRDAMSGNEREAFNAHVASSLAPLANDFVLIDESKEKIIDGFYEAENSTLARQYPNAAKLRGVQNSDRRKVPSSETVSILAQVVYHTFKRM